MKYQLLLLVWGLCPLWGLAAEAQVTIQSEQTQTDAIVVLPLGKDINVGSAQTADGKRMAVQVTAPSLHAKNQEGKELWLRIPELKAKEPLSIKLNMESAKSNEQFVWKDATGTMPELLWLDRPVLRYMRPEFDPKATPAKQTPIANPTIKIFHHLFATDGKTLLTNGPEGKFPHHRGIYFGFNNISYAGKKADVWHCRNGEHQSHVAYLNSEAGSVLGRHRVAINWFGQDNQVFAKEERELTVYHQSKGTLIEFASVVKTDLPKVRLDGDPQHAGFHFRASQEVEQKYTKETYFLRPTGKGEKGKEENWEPKGKKGPVNLPWNAMSFVVADKRYTLLYIDHPNNPKEARQSERTYGRIGNYFEYDLTPEKPLRVQYRLWIQEGEMTQDECEAKTKAFVHPVVASMK